MFQVETYDQYANLPTLRFDGSDAIFGNLPLKEKNLKYTTVRVEGEDSLILAHNLPDLVRFFALTKDKTGYGGGGFTINLDGKVVTIFGPWSSREGCFNTKDGSIAIVSCAVGHVQYHFKLDYLQDLIRKTKANIGFFKVTQFDEREVYYVPCVDSFNQYSRTLVKLQKSYSVKDYVCFIKPDGTIVPINIPLENKK